MGRLAAGDVAYASSATQIRDGAMTEQHQHDSLAEEAARLIEGLQGLLRGGLGPNAGDVSGDVWGEVTDKIATGGPECRLCPFCQLLGMLRHTRPDAFRHLADASESLTAALGDLMRSSWRARSG